MTDLDVSPTRREVSDVCPTQTQQQLRRGCFLGPKNWYIFDILAIN